MNHPDIETCRAIASEFSKSEYVRVDHGKTGFSLEFRVSGDVWQFKNSIPAPTCEELGEWLYIKDKRVEKINDEEWMIIELDTCTPGGYPMYRIVRGMPADIDRIRSKHETQARAEAVKLILELEK